MKEVKAKLRFLRMSPKKVRLVVDMVRGLSLDEALEQLQFSPKSAARPVFKLINSAIANAQNNDKLSRKDLVLKKITVDMGPTLHRWMPRAFGKATPIRKRSSHIEVVLASVNPADKSDKDLSVVDNLPADIKMKSKEQGKGTGKKLIKSSN